MRSPAHMAALLAAAAAASPSLARSLPASSVAVYQHPHPALRTVCQPVTEFGAPVRALVAKMDAAMRSGRKVGVGIAANQIGDFRRVILLDPSGRGHERIVMCNPRIVRSAGTQRVNDGCLSVDEGTRFAATTRAARIRVEYQDEDGNPRKQKAQSYFAAIIQHEIDHLDGVLFIDLIGKAA